MLVKLIQFPMHLEMIGDIQDVETLAAGGRTRNVMGIQNQYGSGCWRKPKGVAKVREKKRLKKRLKYSLMFWMMYRNFPSA